MKNKITNFTDFFRINESVAMNDIDVIMKQLIKAIQDKDEKIVDKRSLKDNSDGEILAQFLLPYLQGWRTGLKDMKSFREIIKKGL